LGTGPVAVRLGIEDELAEAESQYLPALVAGLLVQRSDHRL